MLEEVVAVYLGYLPQCLWGGGGAGNMYLPPLAKKIFKKKTSRKGFLAVSTYLCICIINHKTKNKHRNRSTNHRYRKVET